MTILHLLEQQLKHEGVNPARQYDERGSQRIRHHTKTVEGIEIKTVHYEEAHLDMPINLGATVKAVWGLTACANDREQVISSNESAYSDYSTLTNWRERFNATQRVH